MTELNAVEVQEVSGALDISAGIRAGLHAYAETADLVSSVAVGIYVAVTN
ncbi:MAG: hypothetical protein H7176_11770 [Bdellovibrionales bacterium]|nr:hypothetical protein [Massilia sp.]